jgi:peptidoglycan hydrolase CwlO-like protein
MDSEIEELVLPYREFVEKINQEKDENDEVRYINHISHEFSIKIDKNEHEILLISKHYDEFLSRFDKTELDLESQINKISTIINSLENEQNILNLRLNSSEEKSKWQIGIYLTLLFIMLSTMSFTIEHFVKVARG